MAFDFFGVRMTGRLRQYVSNGKTAGRVIDFWVNSVDSALFDSKALGALSYLSSVEVRHQIGDTSTIKIALTPPFEEGLALIQSDIMTARGGDLEVELEYSTGGTVGGGSMALSTLNFRGMLQKSEVSIGSDITVILNAYGVGHQMNYVGGVETRTFREGISRADAVHETLKNYVTGNGEAGGLNVEKLYAYVDDEAKDPESGDDFFRRPKKLSVSNKKSSLPDANVYNFVVNKGPRNDWWFVRETVQQFGYVMIFEGNQIYIVPNNSIFVSKFAERKQRKFFMLRGEVDPSRNIFPIISFNNQTDFVWEPPGLFALRSTDVKVSKEGTSAGNTSVETSKASVETTSISRGAESLNYLDFFRNGLGFKNLFSKGQAEAVGEDLHPGDPEDADVVASMRSRWVQSHQDNNIQATISTIGIPDLHPGDIIQVGGFEPYSGSWGSPGMPTESAIFNAVYNVHEVNHRVSSAGWETSFLGMVGAWPATFDNRNKAPVRSMSEDAQTTIQGISNIASKTIDLFTKTTEPVKESETKDGKRNVRTAKNKQKASGSPGGRTDRKPVPGWDAPRTPVDPKSTK